MLDKWIYLIHTKQIISSKIFFKKLSINTEDVTQVIDKQTKDIVMKFTNIPINNEKNLYNYQLEKELIYNTKWTNNEYGYLKCIIGVNLEILENYVQNGEVIPSRSILFKLLRKNINKPIQKSIILNFSNSEEIINEKSQKFYYQNKIINNFIQMEKNKSKEYILNKNIKKYGNIYINLELERFYLNILDIQEKIYFVGGILNIEPNCGKIECFLKLVENQKKNTDLENINKNKNNLIITDNISIWKEEIKKYNLKSISIYNKKHYDRYSYQDILKSDIVIISYNYIKNNYPSLLSEYLQNNQSINDAIYTIKMEYNRRNIVKQQSKVLLFLLNWDKIILDNFKENDNDEMIDIFIQNTNATFKWLLTQFSSKDEIDIIKRISKYIVKTDNNITKDFNENLLDNGLMDRIITIRYNNIKQFLSKPNITEKQIDIHQRKSHFKNDIIKKRRYMKLDDMHSFLDPNSYASKISINFKELGSCSICLQNIEKIDIGLLRCGHLFCYKCVNSLSKCPTCRRNLNDTDIVNIETKDTFSLENIEKEYGSKVKYFLKNVNNDTLNTQMIIYSEIENTVKQISDLLQLLGYNIQNNLKKKILPSNTNIYVIYTFAEYEIQYWDKINKIIIWDSTLDNYGKDIFKERNIYRNILGVNTTNICIEYYNERP